MTATPGPGDDLLAGDFSGYQRLLDDDERAVLLRVRSFLDESVAPVVDDHWMRAEFPHDLVKGFAALDLAGLGMAVRVAQLQDEGGGGDAHAALAKGYCSSRMREAVGWARQLFGGNGILSDHHVGPSSMMPRRCTPTKGPVRSTR
jgi:alkylation response protein AidB-like acyl-CoA dehydrogenase